MDTDLNFQRAGSVSNAHVGRDFELLAQSVLASQSIHVGLNFPLELGVGDIKKRHSFDLGCANQKIIIECKSHKWTSGDKVPSAKLTVWNEAMYYFHLAPVDYRKIMFVLYDKSRKRGISLAEYYLDKYNHLIPNDVELWEVNENNQAFRVIKAES